VDNGLLVVVVLTALAFDFTNGFHDTGNAMATTIATGALKPRVAVGLSSVLNLVGAFLSLSVAATIASGIVDQDIVTLPVVFAGLVGGIVWNLATWYLGIPSSSSHALIGGLVGSVIAAAGMNGVEWSGLISKVVIPAVIAPVAAAGVAAVGTWIVYRITRDVPEGNRNKDFRWGQIGSASLVSLAHGTNDAQKTMGIILLALVAGGRLDKGAGVPWWVVLACGAAIAAGTYIGGWRVIRTLGKGLVEIQPPQGMAAETSSAAVILMSSHFGYPLSTTHVASGSILGSGIGRRDTVRWGVARRLVMAWVVTLPASAAVGALAYGVQHWIGGSTGDLVVLAVLVGSGVLFWRAAHRTPVNHTNVNEEWDNEPELGRAAATPVA
jgi:PiT family inorganic phosphate transporter